MYGFFMPALGGPLQWSPVHPAPPSDQNHPARARASQGRRSSSGLSAHRGTGQTGCQSAAIPAEASTINSTLQNLARPADRVARPFVDGGLSDLLNSWPPWCDFQLEATEWDRRGWGSTGQSFLDGGMASYGHFNLGGFFGVLGDEDDKSVDAPYNKRPSMKTSRSGPRQ